MINKLKFILLLLLFISGVGSCNAGEIVDDTLQSINVGDVNGVSEGIRRGLDVNFADQDGNTLLMLAARSGNAEIVALLLNAGARVYPHNVFGDTALLVATFGGYEQVVDMLLAKGGDLGANPQGWTPLHYAAFAGHAHMVNKYIYLGSKVNATTDVDLTPLMVSAMNGHLAVVKILLSHGADPNLHDANDKSAYDHAIARGNTEIAKLLAATQGAKTP